MSDINIKECFVSRWGHRGVIMEVDFSQLEVIGTAIVSGDEMMKQDILDGIDAHSQSASWLNPYSYNEIMEGVARDDPKFVKMRKAAKAPRFELQYGAGATSIARNNGISKKAAQDFIENYYARYSTLKEFQDNLRAAVEATVRPCERRSPSGLPLGVGKWTSSTGRIYTFYEQEAPKFLQDKGILTSISPTQIANYPMQGFSTGDIMGEMLGQLMVAVLPYRDVCMLINTIHDSIILDVQEAHVGLIASLIKSLLTDTPTYIHNRYGIEIDLPMSVDIEYGTNWGEMKRWV